MARYRIYVAGEMAEAYGSSVAVAVKRGLDTLRLQKRVNIDRLIRNDTTRTLLIRVDLMAEPKGK